MFVFGYLMQVNNFLVAGGSRSISIPLEQYVLRTGQKKGCLCKSWMILMMPMFNS